MQIKQIKELEGAADHTNRTGVTSKISKDFRKIITYLDTFDVYFQA